jgi:hypothetical protein
MTRLQRRIARAPGNQQAAAAAYHPAGTSATPMVMPMALITYLPTENYPWGTAVHEELTPVWAPDGALLAARTPGWWGQDMPLPRPARLTAARPGGMQLGH